jgi:CBS domain-containing protein
MPYSKIFARDIMNPDPPYCGLDTSIADVSKRFAEENLTGLLVVDDDKRLFGVITEPDLVDQQRNLHLPTAVAIFDMVIPLGEARFEKELAHMQALTAEDLASIDVETVNADAELGVIASLMADDQIHHLPVLDDGAVVGLISMHDVIKAMSKSA